MGDQRCGLAATTTPPPSCSVSYNHLNEAAKAAVKMPPEDHEDAELDGYPAADK